MASVQPTLDNMPTSCNNNNNGIGHFSTSNQPHSNNTCVLSEMDVTLQYMSAMLITVQQQTLYSILIHEAMNPILDKYHILIIVKISTSCANNILIFKSNTLSQETYSTTCCTRKFTP